MSIKILPETQFRKKNIHAVRENNQINFIELSLSTAYIYHVKFIHESSYFCFLQQIFKMKAKARKSSKLGICIETTLAWNFDRWTKRQRLCRRISLKETYFSLIKFSLQLFLRVQLIISLHRLCNGLAPIRSQAMIWTNPDQVWWRHGTSQSDKELKVSVALHNYFLGLDKMFFFSELNKDFVILNAMCWDFGSNDIKLTDFLWIHEISIITDMYIRLNERTLLVLKPE